MSGFKGGGKRPSFVDIKNKLTGKKELTPEQEQQRVYEREQLDAAKKKAQTEALSSKLTEAQRDAILAEKKVVFNTTTQEDVAAKKNLITIEGLSSQAKADIKNWKQMIEDLTKNINKAEQYLENAAPAAIKQAQKRCEDASKALREAEQEFKQAQNSAGIGGAGVGVTKEQPVTTNAPITHMHSSGGVRKNSDVEEKRNSDLSQKSHKSTSGMSAPPPIPQRPGVEIKGLGTVFTDRDGQQQLAFKGHPNIKVELTTNNPDYVSVIIEGIDYGFTKEEHEKEWTPHIMNVVSDEWEVTSWEEIEKSLDKNKHGSQGPGRSSYQ